MVKQIDSTNGADEVFIKFPSHRQRDKYCRILSNQTAYFSFRRDTGYGCYRATKGEIAKLRAKGAKISVLRKPYDDIHPCWNQK